MGPCPEWQTTICGCGGCQVASVHDSNDGVHDFRVRIGVPNCKQRSADDHDPGCSSVGNLRKWSSGLFSVTRQFLSMLFAWHCRSIMQLLQMIGPKLA